MAENLKQVGQRRRPWLLGAALAFAGLAQLALEARWMPPIGALPSGWVEALRPIWPDARLVSAAIVAFVVAAAAVALALGREQDAWRGEALVDRLRLPRNPATPVLACGAVGGALALSVLLLLSATQYRPAYHRLYLVAGVLLLAALYGSESEGRRERARLHWRRDHSIEAALAVSLLGLFFWLNTFDLGSWYYFAIGDEHAFFESARRIAEGESVNLFSQQGTYSIIPVLSSYVQGQLMRHVFGVTGIGWKASIAFVTTLALLATYAAARTLHGRRVALLTLAMLAAAHYLLAYTHTGYANIESLLPVAAAVFCFAVGAKRASLTAFALAGVWAGLGWYTYYPSRATIVILAVAVLISLPRGHRLAGGTAVAMGFLLLFLPFVAFNKAETVTRMLEQTGAGNTTEMVQSRALLPVYNAGRSLLAFNYNTHDGPYLYGSLAEPITAALFLLGLATLALRFGDRRNRLLLAWLGIGLLVTGVASKYDYVSVSRLLFVMPVVAWIAAIVVERSALVLAPPRAARWAVPAAMSVLGAACIGSNLHRWFVVAPSRVPSTAESLSVRAAERPECAQAAGSPLIVDEGVGGAILPAAAARGGDLEFEFALYGEPPDWMLRLPARCVIFRNPQHPEAVRLMGLIEDRFPKAQASRELDGAGIRSIVVYYPVARDGTERTTSWMNVSE